MAASESSSSRGVDSEEIGESSGGIKEDEWIISIMEEKPLPPQYNKIQKVAPQLRKDKNEFFDPAIVSIGPYHHGKPELEEMEIWKTRMARAFVADSKRDIHEFRNKMLEVVSDARNCYLHGSTEAYDDEAFARMMLVDGCFLLHFIDKFVQNQYDYLMDVLGHLGCGRQPMLTGDLILVENQLPFSVLQTLMSTRRFPEGLIETFIDMVYVKDLETLRNVTGGQRSNSSKCDGDEQPLHFLELVRRRFLRSTKGEDSPHRTSFKLPGWSRLRLLGHRATKKKDRVKKMFGHSFRSATELKARGIHFRPSNTCFLNDFKFTSRHLYGLVTLPQITVTSQTKRVFLNMMADELAPFKFIKHEVCSYIHFINSLINGAHDVMELRSHNIIHNFLGTDEEVAKVFNSLAAFYVNTTLFSVLEDVSDRIQEHYDSKRKTWTAQLLHIYFTTPWTALAFFAATFALVLTFIQTFFPR